MLRLFFFLWLALFCVASAQAQPEPLPAPSVRIGIVAFQDFVVESQKWERFLYKLRDKGVKDIRVALGTHAEVLHWMEEGWLDIAVLPPGVFSVGRDETRFPEANESFEYVATLGYPPAVTHFAHPSRKEKGFHYDLHSVAIVANDSPIKTLDDLLARADELRYVFLHPISATGRLLPESVLRDLDVELNSSNVEFSYSHTNTLRIVSSKGDGLERVGFVHDDALRGTPELGESVRKILIPALENTALPQDVIVIRSDLPDKAKISAAMMATADELDDIQLEHFDDWPSQFAEVDELSRRESMLWRRGKGAEASLDEIGRILLHHAQTLGERPRLAVVLAGGGAKCSYQVGAVSAIEEMLAKLRATQPDLDLDIDLVVGTSGGAVNALPIALGVTSTERGRSQLQQIWRDLDQREILQLAPLPRAILGIWFAVVQFGLILFIARLIFPTFLVGWVSAAAMMLIALVQLYIAQVDYSPWEYLGHNHLLHHLWLLLTFGIRTSSWMLLCSGLLALVVTIAQRRNPAGATWFLKRGSGLYWLLLALLMIVGVCNQCFVQETLSAGSGVEKAITSGYLEMVNTQLYLHGKPAIEVSESSTETVRDVSATIFREGILKRDLVVTGSLLDAQRQELPNDLYFFAAGEGKEEQSENFFGHRGVDVRDHNEMLLDVVMGSGSIFPLFPPRPLHDFPKQGQVVELIDGGFAHNSPIEAAVLWNATHIILIEAAPRIGESRGNLLANIATAFGHLHEQTQQVDYRSKQQVVSFTLTPKPPHICVLDFADNLIAKSIQSGYDDAWGKSTHGAVPRRTFKKELGEPIFYSLPTVE